MGRRIAVSSIIRGAGLGHIPGFVDVAAGRVTSSTVRADDPRESGFAVATVPDSFDDPPAKLAFDPSLAFA